MAISKAVAKPINESESENKTFAQESILKGIKEIAKESGNELAVRTLFVNIRQDLFIENAKQLNELKDNDPRLQDVWIETNRTCLFVVGEFLSSLDAAHPDTKILNAAVDLWYKSTLGAVPKEKLKVSRSHEMTLVNHRLVGLGIASPRDLESAVKIVSEIASATTLTADKLGLLFVKDAVNLENIELYRNISGTRAEIIGLQTLHEALNELNFFVKTEAFADSIKYSQGKTDLGEYIYAIIKEGNRFGVCQAEVVDDRKNDMDAVVGIQLRDSFIPLIAFDFKAEPKRTTPQPDASAETTVDVEGLSGPLLELMSEQSRSGAKQIPRYLLHLPRGLINKKSVLHPPTRNRGDNGPIDAPLFQALDSACRAYIEATTMH